MIDDPSRGWDAAADAFVEARSDVGLTEMRRWAGTLPKGGAVVDIGCGTGFPVSVTLAEAGLRVWGVDASPRLVEEFRRRLPDAEAACEPAETSSLFGRTFDGAVAIGLLFLLPPPAQHEVIARAGRALKPGGRFLFTAPSQVCKWNDVLTGQRSRSLGTDAYRMILEDAGLRLEATFEDRGSNHYYDAVRDPS